MNRNQLRALVAGATIVLATPIAAGTAQAGPLAEPLGTATGRVVNSVTGAPVANAAVTFTQLGTRHRWSTRTGRDGRFRIADFPIEEHALTITGPRGYESGFVGCDVNRFVGAGLTRHRIMVKPVVPTWGEACSMGAQALGRIDLDPRPLRR